jgi:methionyl-tRNA formyltransferase
VPAIVHDIRRFYAARGARLTALGPRGEYDRRTVELLAPFRPDLVVLSGYLHILTAPALEAFPNRIVNVHDADLTVLDAGGRPRYRGLRSTRDAVFAGAAETRSTVHLVTPEVDVGPLLVRSWAFPVHVMVDQARDLGSGDVLRAYAYAQREWMMCAAWGPMLARTIDVFARDDVRLLGGRAVVAGALGPLELPAPLAARASQLGAVGG